MVTPGDFIHRLQSTAEEVSLNNHNNHTVGFHPHNRELLLHVLIT